jgi:asparagine synthase (glutamine-hydrolysing)
MCGIAGIIHKKRELVSEMKLMSMRDSMLHRGPDAGSLWINENIAFAHRRLSIVDLSDAATQPFHSECGRYVLVFNGEIFNYLELKKDLELKGISLRTKSDTEVLLNLLIHEGTLCLQKLIGFWAIAFHDRQTKETLFIRDRMGIKPFFYCENDEYFAFASEPKALFAYGFPKAMAEEYLEELFLYRHVSGENTIFNGVKRMLPGYFMRLNGAGEIIEKKRWFHLGEEAKKFPEIKNPHDWFEETFLSSVKYRMIADVKVGTMLSGGLDSSSVLYAQYKLGFNHTSAWNIAFTNQKHDESAIARKFASSLGFDFHSFEFDKSELAGLTREAIYFSDEPFMHMQEPQLLGLSKRAKQEVTVLLSGEAADELLGGYVRYKVHDNQLRYRMLQLLRFVPSKYIKSERWLKMQRYLHMRNQDAQLIMNANGIYLKDLEDWNISALNLLPEYRLSLLEEAKSMYPNNRLRQLMYMEQFTHVPSLNDRNDRVSMGASIENREPFEDYRLTTGVFSLSDEYFPTKGKGKKLLMETIGEKLPTYITENRKIGLSIPWDDIILSEPYFREHFNEMLKSPLMKMGLYGQLELKEEVELYKNRKSRCSSLIRQVFFHTLWYKEMFIIGK